MSSLRFKLVFDALFILLIILFGLTGCSTLPIEQRPDYVPMYGQPETPRPEFLKGADEAFIKKASSEFGGNRELASMAWAAVGEDYMSKGDTYNAMRRYNQAWLLNPNNYVCYWGFGRVMLERHEYDEALKYFEKAKQLINDDYQKPALISDTGAAYSFKAQSIPMSDQAERDKYFRIANQHFKEAIELDSSYVEVWRRWAYSLYREGKYSESWEKVEKARSAGANPLPAEFLSALKAELRK